MRILLTMFCVGAFLSAMPVNAEIVSLQLHRAAIDSPNGSLDLDIDDSSAAWVYDTSTDRLTGMGMFSAQANLFSTFRLFTHTANDLAVGAGLAAAAATFECIEGNFGPLVAASICGGYNFGPNRINQSTANWGPGTAYNRTIGGDDVAIGPQQSLHSNYDGMAGAWDGTVLIMSNVIPATSGVQFSLAVAGALIDVADFRGMPEADALAAILAGHLTVGVVNTASSDYVAMGDVISQQPEACVNCVEPFSTIDLLVSSGAAILPLELVDAKIQGQAGLGTAILTNSTATWEFDTATRIVTGAGLYSAQYQIIPSIPGQLFTHEMVDAVIGGGQVATATSFNCIEGSFGAIAAGHLCGNYSFGQNGRDDSTVSYGPGTSYSRTLGGDDVIQGTQQNLQRYGGMTTQYDGSTVYLWRPYDPDLGGHEMTFNVLPLPLRVYIDIKPGESGIAAINPSSNGVTPVAILTTVYFDATQVDASTVGLGPNSAGIDDEQGHIEDVDGDGDSDLMLHFRTQATGIACGDTEATLTGATFAGERIIGTGRINTTGKECK